MMNASLIITSCQKPIPWRTGLFSSLSSMFFHSFQLKKNTLMMWVFGVFHYSLSVFALVLLNLISNFSMSITFVSLYWPNPSGIFTIVTIQKLANMLTRNTKKPLWTGWISIQYLHSGIQDTALATAPLPVILMLVLCNILCIQHRAADASPFFGYPAVLIMLKWRVILMFDQTGPKVQRHDRVCCSAALTADVCCCFYCCNVVFFWYH